MHGHVFISYASHDREIADRLCGTLESRGIACWIAPRDIQPGAEWAEQIIDGISSADVMLLIFSSHSNASPQVRREIERAVHRQVPLLPVRVENVLPSKGMEYFLGTSHWLDAHDGSIERHEAAILRAVDAMRSKHDRAEPGRASELAAPAMSTRPPVAVAPAEPAAWTPAALARLQSLLAEYVGPVAGALVKRAAAQARDHDSMIDTLAAEVDDVTARNAFVTACRNERWSAG
jgi:hypothetical protein